MRNLILAGVATISICCSTPVFAEQSAGQAQPPVLQTQANPPGAGIPSMTPPDPVTAGSAVQPSMPADTSYRAGPYKGALTPPPPQAMNQAYPVCTSKLRDSCVNPGEAGARSAVAKPSHRRARHSRRN